MDDTLPPIRRGPLAPRPRLRRPPRGRRYDRNRYAIPASACQGLRVTAGRLASDLEATRATLADLLEAGEHGDKTEFCPARGQVR